MSDAVLDQALTVRYGKSTACAAVSLDCEPGTVYVLLGRNGAGKTSLVRCVLGQQKPSEGQALLFGADSWTTRARARTRTGVVPEEPDAPPAMTATAILDFSRRLYPTWDAAASSARLERFGVPADVPFGRLSKGRRNGPAHTAPASRNLTSTIRRRPRPGGLQGPLTRSWASSPTAARLCS
jgi:ABC-2 type transport system ATP-binding protein